MVIILPHGAGLVSKVQELITISALSRDYKGDTEKSATKASLFFDSLAKKKRKKMKYPSYNRVSLRWQ